MEKMPILFLIFYGIPENLVLITLSSCLYGYDIKNNFKRILLLSIAFILTVYVVRSLPIKFGLNILIQAPIFVILTVYFLKVNYKQSLLFIVTFFIIGLISENVFMPIVIYLSGQNLNSLFVNVWSRFLLAWCNLILLLLPTVFIVKQRITLMTAFQVFRDTTINTKISFMIAIVMAQAFLAGLLQMASVFEQYSVFPVAFNSELLKNMIGIALITIPIVSIFLLKRLFDLSQKEAIAATQEAFIDNINNLFVIVRGQRHDFINHVQVIYSMLKSGQREEAIKYMDNLLDEIQEINEVIKTKDPALSALLNTKSTVADRHNITFETDIDASTESLNIKSLDLVKILGNLLDNAIEAVRNQPQEFRKVKLSIKKYHNVYVFEVFNPQPVIPPEQIDKIFIGGFSTKQDARHSGLGLAVVKEITEKYNGQIGVKSTEQEGTTFTVVIPV